MTLAQVDWTTEYVLVVTMWGKRTHLKRDEAKGTTLCGIRFPLYSEHRRIDQTKLCKRCIRVAKAEGVAPSS